MRNMWFNLILGILDTILHYLAKKGVIDLEDLSDQHSPFWSEGEFDRIGVIKRESESPEEEG